MTIWGSESIATWEIAIAMLMATSAAILTAALWPPFHWRRLITAGAFLLVCLSTYVLDRVPPLRLPLQLTIFAECSILTNPSFVEKIGKLERELGSLNATRLVIVPDEGASVCAESVPAIAGLEVILKPQSLTYEDARAEAIVWLDGDAQSVMLGLLRPFTTARVAIAHVPGSRLGPPNGDQAAKPLKLSDGRRAVVLSNTYGIAAVRHMQVSVVPGIVSELSGLTAILLELVDPRLESAKEIEVTGTVHAMRTLAGSPGVPPSCKSISWPMPTRTESLATSTSPIDSWGTDIHVARLPGSAAVPPGLAIYVKAERPEAECALGKSWVAFDFTVTVRLNSGDPLVSTRRIYVPVLPVNGVTLVTPDDTAPMTRRSRAMPGWEYDANAPGYGLDGDVKPVHLLEQIFAATSAGGSCGEGCLSIPRAPWQLTRACWFKGEGEVTARRAEFEGCLEQTRRLLWVAPSATTLVNAESMFHIDLHVRSGDLDVMVAAPDYGPGEELPPWAPVLRDVPEIRSEPRLHVVLSRRDSLRIRAGGTSGLAVQQAFFDALRALPLLGSATENPIAPSQSACTIDEADDSFPLHNHFLPQGALAWFGADPAIAPLQASELPALSTPPAVRAGPQRRDKGVFRLEKFVLPVRTSGARGRAFEYSANIVCSSPWLDLARTLERMEERGELASGAERVPRATIVLLAEDGAHVGLEGVRYFEQSQSACGSSGIVPAAVRDSLRAYLQAGGSVLILPVRNSLGQEADVEVIEYQTKQPSITLSEFVKELRDLAPDAGDIVYLSSFALNDGIAAQTVAREALDQVFKLWRRGTNLHELAAVTIGDGSLTSREDVCAPNLASNTSRNFNVFGNGCAFRPGSAWATALNRRNAVPERMRFLESISDPFVSGVQRTCARDEIARSIPHEMGRVAALGYSPLARDVLAANIADVRMPNSGALALDEQGAIMRRGQCYQQSAGRRVSVTGYTSVGIYSTQSMPVSTHGGLTLLERFAEFASIDRPIRAPRVLSVATDPETGALEIVATGDATTDWVWSPKARLAENGIELRPRFASLNRHTGNAHFVIAPENPVPNGLLEFTLYENRGTNPGPPELTYMPVSFPSRTPSGEMAELRPVDFSAPSERSIDLSGLAVFGMLMGTLLMFSPLARRWRVAEETLAAALGRKEENPFGLVGLKAPLFSLEAGLAEWGMHPGRPAAIRSFGLPAGLRRWRSGDRGGAIRQATLFAIAARLTGIPPQMPQVNLRTASEAANVLVLIEGNGALLSPRSRLAPGKSAFAARFGAFLAHAVRLSHGVAEIRRAGREPIGQLEPPDTESAILHDLHQPPYCGVPGSDADSLEGKSRRVYYICDGLSINPDQLLAFAGDLSAERGELRVAAVVSPDDKNAVGLRRDPFDGTFDDDTETPPAIILNRRDRRLDELAVRLARVNGVLIVVDCDLDTQGLLERMNETGFLN